MELTEDLAKTLPRWVGWIPIVGRATFRWWQGSKDRALPQNNFTIELVSARVDVSARDEGSVNLHFSIANFGKRGVEIDRLELHSLGINSRQLQRRSDTIKMTGWIRSGQAVRNHVDINLHEPDVRSLIHSIEKSQNQWSTPRMSVSFYGEILCISGKDRFRKVLQTAVSEVECFVSSRALADVLPPPES